MLLGYTKAPEKYMIFRGNCHVTPISLKIIIFLVFFSDIDLENNKTRYFRVLYQWNKMNVLCYKYMYMENFITIRLKLELT